MVVMDQSKRRIIGFALWAGDVDGIAACEMFNRAGSRKGTPRYLSWGHDPQFEHHPWHADQRVPGVGEIKTVAYMPLSRPFVGRLIGTMRREFLDEKFFWNARELEGFKGYYNEHKVHLALAGRKPDNAAGEVLAGRADPHRFRWRALCRGRCELPLAA